MNYEIEQAKAVLGAERYTIVGTYSFILKDDTSVCLKLSRIKGYKNGKPVRWGSFATITGFETVEDALDFYNERVLADDKKKPTPHCFGVGTKEILACQYCDVIRECYDKQKVKKS